MKRSKVKSKKGKAKVHKVMHEFYKDDDLHSGSKNGPKVKSRKQAVAIALSEARNATKKSVRLVLGLSKGRGGFHANIQDSSPADRDVKIGEVQQYHKLLESHGYTPKKERMPERHSQEYNPSKYKYSSTHVYEHPESKHSASIDIPHSKAGRITWMHGTGESTKHGRNIAGLAAHLSGKANISAKSFGVAEKLQKRGDKPLVCSLCHNDKIIRVVYKSDGQEHKAMRPCPVCVQNMRDI